MCRLRSNRNRRVHSSKLDHHDDVGEDARSVETPRRSSLGLFARQKMPKLERRGVSTEVRLRHGIVIDQVFESARGRLRFDRNRHIAGAGDCLRITSWEI